MIPPDRNMELKSVSACEDCLWCCDLEYQCWVRTEINSKNPIGVKWISPDLGNLEGEKIAGISCGLLSMWAVSTKGDVWLRFGSSPTKHTFGKTLSPVWLRLSSDCGGENIPMKQVGSFVFQYLYYQRSLVNTNSEMAKHIFRDIPTNLTFPCFSY